MKYIYLMLLLAVSSLAQASVRPADGMWVTSDDPEIGSGLMMTTQNGVTLISIFTYDQAGKNAWYITSGQVDDAGMFEAELRQTQNGQNVTIDNPESASFTDTIRTLSLKFSGTQVGTMSIDGSEPKDIHAHDFGFESPNGFPEIAGEWVLGNAESKESVILNLTADPIENPGSSPVYVIDYSSSHPSSVDWEIFCIVGYSSEQVCFFQPDNSSEIPELQTLDLDIGNQRLELKSLDSETKYQAFRLDQDRRLLPNDGHWRPADDPAIGSGLVMRTQGDHTIALLYTYDDQGAPIWQIASGMFDENGYMEADLDLPMGGTAIENGSPMTAEWGDAQTIEIQLQGLELATFSIDDSTPKAVQSSNFGARLFETEHFIVEDESLMFPDQSGNWVVANYSSQEISSAALEVLIASDGNLSPAPPGLPLLYSGLYQLDVLPNNFEFTFYCMRSLINASLAPNCFGDYFSDGFTGDSLVYFEDIGYSRFRMYIGSTSDISRDSDYLDFFRLED